MAMDRIMSYLLATKDFKIKGVYSPKLDILLPYSDSDWAGDMPITTCSHSGTMITLNDYLMTPLLDGDLKSSLRPLDLVPRQRYMPCPRL